VAPHRRAVTPSRDFRRDAGIRSNTPTAAFNLRSVTTPEDSATFGAVVRELVELSVYREGSR
jgi:hypothetical protein